MYVEVSAGSPSEITTKKNMEAGQKRDKPNKKSAGTKRSKRFTLPRNLEARQQKIGGADHQEGSS